MPTIDVISQLPQLITQQDLRNRLSANVLKQFADDDKSGTPDRSVLAQIVKDASATVWSYIGDTFVLNAGDPVPDYLVTLTLDVAQAKVYLRFPQSSLGSAGFNMLAIAEKALQRLQSGAQKIKPPPPPDTPDAAPEDGNLGVVVSCQRISRGRSI